MAEQLRLDLDLTNETALPTVRVRSINEKEIANWQHGPTFVDYLRLLVRDGWTLSRVVHAKTLIYQRRAAVPEVEPALSFAAQRDSRSVS